MPFLSKARQASNADNPQFGSGDFNPFVDNDKMVGKEVVFGVTDIRWDPDNVYQGNPRPRWLLDVVPWYEGESLPGSKQDERGRPAQLDVGTISLASQKTRDQMIKAWTEGQEGEPGLYQQWDDDEDYVEGPLVLVKIRVPGGRGGNFIDVCEWDEKAQAPSAPAGEVVREEEPPPPRRPSSRQAPARNGAAGQQAPSSGARAPRGRARQEEAEPEPEPEEPAPQRGTQGFADAGGPESGGQEPAAAPAEIVPAGDAELAIASLDDLNLVSDVLGLVKERYASEFELAEEYGAEEFPALKDWLVDHGIPIKKKGEKGPGIPEGRGRIDQGYRDAYSIALRCHTEVWAAAPQDNATRTSPNPAVRSGRVRPSGSTAPRPPAEPPERAEDLRSSGRARQVRPAEVPDNARHQVADKRPEGADDVTSEGQSRAAGKAAWMPPDEAQRRARGATAASEHVYEPGDVGDSIDPCPVCHEPVTGRALPSGGNAHSIMHKCDKDGATRPLLAHNIRRG